ncbi:STAS domain-containing protein [Nonomuraea sp. NPDC046570]|uniref:STAS domain-containing protein n=1 Tax=Nonomuraea sp. NPDC046570 TaxID=3155255 RepID=UPI0033C9994D
MDPLRLSTRTVNGHALVGVGGEIDLATAPELCAHVAGVLDTGVTRVTLDLGGVTFMDASGLTALLVLRRHALGTGATLHLAALPRQVRLILRVTGLDACFAVPPQSGSADGDLARRSAVADL